MTAEQAQIKQLARELINKDKWADAIHRFIDVLKINIFFVDFCGEVIIPPYSQGERGIYGNQFLSLTFGFDLTGQKDNFLSRFRQHGPYLEFSDALGLHVFAIPVKGDRDQIVAYLVVGPVILNKRQDGAVYQDLAGKAGISIAGLEDALFDVRVVSFLTIKAILDLLSEIAKDIIDLNLEKRKLDQSRLAREVISREMTEAAQDLFATIHLDELLVTVLDLALNLTQAECGSLMLMDKDSGDLTIKVSRGIENDKYRNVRIKLGEGIAGIAAQENRAFIISGTEGDNRIKPFLKRDDIKQAAVVPLASRNRVVGVLNLHTKNPGSNVEFNEKSLQHLSRLISTAIQTL